MTTIHRIDRDDIITYVDSPWIEFARENRLPNAVEDDYIGHSLWDFVSGDSTVHLWKRVLEKVRGNQKVILLPYRCDSPDLKRYMSMGLIPLPSNGIEMYNRILSVEPQAPVALLDPSSSRDETHISMCSWCKKILDPVSGKWLDTEEAIKTMNLFNQPTQPEISHGVCDACEATVLLAFEEDFSDIAIVDATAKKLLRGPRSRQDGTSDPDPLPCPSNRSE